MRLPLLTSLAKRLASTQNMNTTGESVDVQKEEDLSQEGNWFSLDELQPRKDLEWPGFCSGGPGHGYSLPFSFFFLFLLFCFEHLK